MLNFTNNFLSIHIRNTFLYKINKTSYIFVHFWSAFLETHNRGHEGCGSRQTASELVSVSGSAVALPTRYANSPPPCWGHLGHIDAVDLLRFSNSTKPISRPVSNSYDSQRLALASLCCVMRPRPSSRSALCSRRITAEKLRQTLIILINVLSILNFIYLQFARLISTMQFTCNETGYHTQVNQTIINTLIGLACLIFINNRNHIPSYGASLSAAGWINFQLCYLECPFQNRSPNRHYVQF